MADDKTKLAGQRNAVKEHIEKWRKYPLEQDKEYALKTIKNAQNRIKLILDKHPHWAKDDLDTWTPKNG